MLNKVGMLYKIYFTICCNHTGYIILYNCIGGILVSLYSLTYGLWINDMGLLSDTQRTLVS